jgi:hypothetical protein
MSMVLTPHFAHNSYKAKSNQDIVAPLTALGNVVLHNGGFDRECVRVVCASVIACVCARA